MKLVPVCLLLACLLLCELHPGQALPAEASPAEASAPAVEPVAQRDPEHEHEHPDHHGEHPPAPPSGGGLHIPYPSEIIHAVGNLVHGAAQQHHEQHLQQHHQQHHTTHRPPHRPLLHREKIKATKTVFVEYTKLVTRHPVCLAVQGVKPPCLPYVPHVPNKHKVPVVAPAPCQHGLREEPQQDGVTGEEDADEEDDIFNETEEGVYISPTAVAELPSATAAYDDLEASARSARYLELRPPAPPAAPASATPALPVGAAQSGLSETEPAQLGRQHSGSGGPISGLLPHNRPEIIYETKTLWVTKVQKVMDYRVTATLIAGNCIPTDSKIPLCEGYGHGPTYGGGDEIVLKPPHKPVHKPVHHRPVHHRPVHHRPPVHHPPPPKPVHHPPPKPVHHEPVHKPAVHEPVHKPVVHEPVHKPAVHEPVHKPAVHEPVHKPVVQEPVHKPAVVHKPAAHKPVYDNAPYGLEYTELPDEHWKEGEEEAAAAAETVAEGEAVPSEESDIADSGESAEFAEPAPVEETPAEQQA